MPSETEFLIDSLCAQFRKLLCDHWVEWWGYRPEQKPIKGTLSFSIDPCRADYELNSHFGFGIRLKHSVCDHVDSPAQTQLKLDERGNGQKTKANPLR